MISSGEGAQAEAADSVAMLQFGAVGLFCESAGRCCLRAGLSMEMRRAEKKSKQIRDQRIASE